MAIPTVKEQIVAVFEAILALLRARQLELEDPLVDEIESLIRKLK